MTECPQCDTMNDDDAKNCQGCRVNLYWAFQHYEELAALPTFGAGDVVESDLVLNVGTREGWADTADI